MVTILTVISWYIVLKLASLTNQRRDDELWVIWILCNENYDWKVKVSKLGKLFRKRKLSISRETNLEQKLTLVPEICPSNWVWSKTFNNEKVSVTLSVFPPLVSRGILERKFWLAKTRKIPTNNWEVCHILHCPFIDWLFIFCNRNGEIWQQFSPPCLRRRFLSYSI